MDKRQERRIFDYVFGRRDVLDVTECERPDFVCRVSASFSFGVEVAEFYVSESEARLRKIEGYAEGLLTNEEYRHKDDKVRIPVRNIIYRHAETGQEIPLKAIMHGEASAAGVTGRFCGLIREECEVWRLRRARCHH
ncbi:MAG: hypothetical protein ABSG86_28740 [Thermoguttaceae bacterium]|jgi:hypothetical protein